MGNKAIVVLLSVILVVVLGINIISSGWPRLINAVERDLQITELRQQVADLQKQVNDLRVQPYIKEASPQKTTYPWDQ